MNRLKICLFGIHSGIPRVTFLLVLSIFHLKVSIQVITFDQSFNTLIVLIIILKHRRT